ncbi:MAG TPA: ABC transporter ATP-binding protein [Ignavibacteria bacterium]|nr:ABC transporter ATP-binding protein [Ignavibacteria bacterium]HMR41162.1 ABC transporter ATP-binding protein [Ignavibacteria bacterium]
MIEIKDLHMSYGKFKALKGIDLKIEKGQVAALMGPNGSGKSTLLKSILGLVIPESGKILISGTDIKDGYLYRNNVGYMPQIANYPENLKVRELFDIVKDIRNGFKKTDEELIEKFKIHEISEKYFGQLSGGYKQRVTASIAFLFDPEILILDEPTASLDPLSTEIIKTKILETKKKDKLIIISSHIISEMDELAGRIIYLLDGSVKLNLPVKDIKNGSGERLGKAITRVLSKSPKI